MSTHVLHFLLDVHTASPLRAFKSEMFQEVGNSVICVVFISASRVDKDTHGARLSVSSLQIICTAALCLLEKERALRSAAL